MAKSLKITQVKSAIDRHYKQKRTLEALGIKKVNGTVIQADNPVIRGMVKKISHLLTVEEVEA